MSRYNYKDSVYMVATGEKVTIKKVSTNKSINSIKYALEGGLVVSESELTHVKPIKKAVKKTRKKKTIPPVEDVDSNVDNEEVVKSENK